MNEPSNLTRRTFLKGSSFATLMSLLGGVELTAQTPPPEADKPAGPKVKCGLIGLGTWGREIISNLSRVREAQLVALCDTYGVSLRRAAKLAPEAKAIEDYRALLDDKEVQAVLIATPSHQHREIAVAALQAGKHVYCEAPLAASLDDARAIARAAKAAVKQVFQ